MTEVDARTVAFAVLEPLLHDVRKHVAALAAFNDLPNIPWHVREGIRTIEGHLDKIDRELALNLADRLRENRSIEIEGDPAIAFIEKMWPED